MASYWWIGLAANAVAGVAFLAVAAVLAANAIKTRQVRNNPLGLATVVLYLTCGGGHAVHALQLLDSPLGRPSAAGAAIMMEYNANLHMWVIDILTAVAGIAYWMMRRRFPALVSGAAVFEDLRARQRRALEIHDNVVQGLARAKLALDLKEDKEGNEAVGDTLDRARHIITDLLGQEGARAGAVRRPAGGEHGR